MLVLLLGLLFHTAGFLSHHAIALGPLVADRFFAVILDDLTQCELDPLDGCRAVIGTDHLQRDTTTYKASGARCEDVQGNWTTAKESDISCCLSLIGLSMDGVFVEIKTAADVQGDFVSFVELPGSINGDLEFVFDLSVCAFE